MLYVRSLSRIIARTLTWNGTYNESLQIIFHKKILPYKTFFPKSYVAVKFWYLQSTPLLFKWTNFMDVFRRLTTSFDHISFHLTLTFIRAFSLDILWKHFFLLCVRINCKSTSNGNDGLGVWAGIYHNIRPVMYSNVCDNYHPLVVTLFRTHCITLCAKMSIFWIDLSEFCSTCFSCHLN